MKKIAVLLLSALALVQMSCCLDLGGREKRFRKRMLCARRVNNDNSIDILKKGAFCCPRLPSSANDISSARRYYYMKAAEIYPDRGEVLAAIGQTFWEEGRFGEASDYYGKATRACPDDPSYLIAAITLERIGKKYDDALASISRLEKMSFPGRDKAAAYLKGKILYEQNQPDAARELLEATLSGAGPADGTFYLGPTPYAMKDVFFYLAMIQLKKGERMKAHEYFLQYLSKEGHPDFVSLYQGWLKQSGGEQDFLYEMVEEGWTRTHQ